MQFFSTRNTTIRRTPSEAITEGLAPGGGLYLPERFPPFPMEKLAEMSGNDISVTVLGALFDDFSKNELRAAVSAAYDAHFENGDIAPLASVGAASVMELWHGPTCAFKDVALCLLPHLLTAARKKCGISDDICILTATSGDTGSAALSGFSDVPGTHIIVFYPDGGVSPMQKRQMVTCPGKNTAVCAVRGNFDDAQTGVKRIFADTPDVPGIRFSSANSINIGRLAPQIAYYFKAYRDLLRAGRVKFGDPVDFVVPTGNFGDILAGIFAEKMGLPVGRFVCASNENRVLTDFFTTGVYDRNRVFRLTSSPSMDILISSNLERLLCLYDGAEKTAAYMKDLNETGKYAVSPETLAALQEKIYPACADDAATAAAIRRVYRERGYLMDPHTAVGWCAYEQYLASGKSAGRPTVLLSTASPFKFTRTVLRALDLPVGEDEFENMKSLSAFCGLKLPAALAASLERPVRHTDVTDPAAMRTYVGEKIQTI